MNKNIASTGIFVVCILTAVFAVLYPALSSPLYIDDYANLHDLTEIKTSGYTYYVFNGFASSLGRPLSLLTFAIQHNDWPHNPFSFKLVNLIIHLFNGLLIFFISRILFEQLKFSPKEINIASLLVMSLWLLHPIHFTTTFYVVQRMTQLSALFTLAGFLGYLISRRSYFNGNRLYGLMGMSLSVGLGITLGVLAKENAILLPLYILAAEITILPSDNRTVEWKIWAWIFLALPLVMLLMYLIASVESISNYSHRPFTIGERLLTQAVVLVTYLKNIVLPQSGAFSIYQDDFPISTGLFSPPATFLSIMFLVTMFSAAVYFRKKYSLASFAVLWFFAGHVLESTFISLEIYFEHRNYLPAFGILFLYGGLIIFIWRSIKSKVMRLTAAVIPCLIIIGVSFVEVSIWKNPLLQAHEWARHHPTSYRALSNLASMYIRGGYLDNAENVYTQYIQAFPEDLYPHIRIARMKSCFKDEKLTETEWHELNQKAENFKWQNFSLDAELDSIVVDVYADRCPEMDVIQFAIFLLTLANNPDFSRSAGLYHEFVAALSLKLKDLNAALMNIREGVRLSPKPNRQIFLIEMELAMKHIDDAEQSIQEFEKYLSGKTRLQIAYRDKLFKLKLDLEELKTEVMENES